MPAMCPQPTQHLAASCLLVQGQQVPPLPPGACAARAGGGGQVFDLHAAHARSSELVPPSASTFVTPKWRPLRPGIPQIPLTFPPKCAAALLYLLLLQGGGVAGRGVTPPPCLAAAWETTQQPQLRCGQAARPQLSRSE